MKKSMINNWKRKVKDHKLRQTSTPSPLVAEQG